MCRLLGYVGPRVDLEGVLYLAPFGLEHQAWAPRAQQHGTINADGWGIGWYDRAIQPEPARYRTAAPMWNDRAFREMARLLSSSLFVAAVRDATPGLPVEESGSPPFREGRYLFAHNGLIEGFRSGVGTALRRSLSPERDAAILGASDSEVAFALVLTELDKGASLEDALRGAVGSIRELTDGRFNFLLSDGEQLAASVAGDNLFAWASGDEGDPERATLLASEPLDDELDWILLPDEVVVVAAQDRVTRVEPL